MTRCYWLVLASRLLDVVSKKTKIIAKSYENRIWKFEEVSLSQGMNMFVELQICEEQNTMI